MADEKRFCEKEGKVFKQEEFYQTSNLEKYPDGYLNMCKRCLTMHVDNFEPKTFTWILQEIDVPYIPDEWNKLLARYGRDRSKLTGTTILGRYLAKMKLKQYKDFRWADNKFLQELADLKVKETMERQGYSAAQIAEVINTNNMTMPEGDVDIPEYDDPKPIQAGNPETYGDYLTGFIDEQPQTASKQMPAQIPFPSQSSQVFQPSAQGGPIGGEYVDPFGGVSLAANGGNNTFIPPFDDGSGFQPTIGGGSLSPFADDDEDEELELTDDDRKYLRLKWGKTYRPFEWVQLEQLYKEMTDSYDIQSAGDKNTLLLMCKTSLKANQLLDLGD